MEILYFDKLDSTHKFLLRELKSKNITSSTMIVANSQESGIGTANNSWISLDGNLFLSFCIDLNSLPNDLPKQSISIYFAYLLKEFLTQKGSNVWLKWPNDFYIDNKKIGGVLATIIGDMVVCSIGLNLLKAPKKFSILDINIDKNEIIQNFILKIKSKKSWMAVFKIYKIEFEKSKQFLVRVDNKKSSMQDAILFDDGSIKIKNRRVYSTR